MLVVAIALAVGCGPSASPPGATAPTPPANCTATIVGTRKLRLEDGRWLRIEATAAVVADGEVLIAGVPANITRVDTDGSEHFEAPDSLIGALVHSSGQVTPIYAPIKGSAVTAVRGQRLPNGHWLLTFGEAADGGDTLIFERRILRMWSGEFDDGRWTRVQQVTLASGAAGARQASPMVRRGDTVLVAMPQTNLRDAVLLRYMDGEWTQERVPTPGFAEVAIASDSTGVPVMTVVRADATRHRDVNSLFLLRDEPTWHEVTRVAVGGDEPINFAAPIFGTSSWLVWASEITGAAGNRWELRARRLDGHGMPIDTTIVIEHAIWRFATTTSAAASEGYIVAATNAADEAPRLRVYATTPVGLVRLLDVRNPYADFRAAAMLSRDRLLLVGRSEPQPGEASFQSVVVTVSTSCSRRAP